jgi:hypothetical protein
VQRRAARAAPKLSLVVGFLLARPHCCLVLAAQILSVLASVEGTGP